MSPKVTSDSSASYGPSTARPRQVLDPGAREPGDLAVNRVFCHSQLPTTGRLLLVAVALHEAAPEALERPTVAGFAAQARVSERTVRRAIAGAVAAGELRVTHDEHGPRYESLIACPEGCQEHQR